MFSLPFPPLAEFRSRGKKGQMMLVLNSWSPELCACRGSERTLRQPASELIELTAHEGFPAEAPLIFTCDL